MIFKIVQASLNSHKKMPYRNVPSEASFGNLNHSGPQTVLKEECEILAQPHPSDHLNLIVQGMQCHIM